MRQHLSLSSTPGVRWIVAFFRQFFGSVTKVDYLTMRQGFINPPIVILLLIGTKLDIVIMEMAQDIQDRGTVIKGAPVVEPSNKFFWFNRPGWVLFLIHLTLFQNAFQMAHFVWTLATPGFKKCYHENMGLSIMKVVVAVAVQVLCSYITFPLYALVAQMGSHMKTTIFEEQTVRALMNWRNVAREKKKIREVDAYMAQMSGDTTPSRGTSPSQVTSPVHLLHKQRVRSDYPQSAPASPRLEEAATDMYPVAQPLQRLDLERYMYPVAQPLHRLDTDRRRAEPSPSADDIDIANADFSFRIQR